MSSSKKLLQAAAGAGGAEPLNVEDVFSSTIYEGNGSTQTITNGLDLSGEGGFVWLKDRDSANPHWLFDTARGVNKYLKSTTIDSENTSSSSLTSFNSDGFSIGNDTEISTSSNRYVSWSFLKAAGFFDVVQYTGDGTSSRTINHNLGTTVGFIIIKRTDAVSNWTCYHRGLTDPRTYIELNKSDGESSDTSFFPTAPTDTQFTVGNDGSINASGGSYVAYIFAHNDGDGEFGADQDLDIIKCGSFTGGADSLINLGWEAQWVLIKYISGSGQNWFIHDTSRGWTVDAEGQMTLEPNVIDTEDFGKDTALDTRGFRTINSSSGNTYIYVAIRKGTRIPEDATKVFDTLTWTGNGSYDREIGPNSIEGLYDAAIVKRRNGASDVKMHYRRTRNSTTYVLEALNTHESYAETDNSGWQYPRESNYLKIRPSGDTNYHNISGNTYVAEIWKQARGFFDIACYEGNGTAGHTISHNLGVAPEMIWIKGRTNASDWQVYHSGVDATAPEDYYLKLNGTDVRTDSNTRWNDTAPTSTTFTLGNRADLNSSGNDFIAFLFASVDGVSKVGSYTGNGSSQTIDCGFSSGARFVLTKSTNITGNWTIWDSERGIVAGDDPRLYLNLNDAEYIDDDSIDPSSSGFSLTSSSFANENGINYIFYAIA